MRIAVFSNTYYPTVNGVAISAEMQRAEMERLGHEVHVFAPAPRGYDTSRDDERIHRFPSLDAPVEVDYQVALPFSRDVREALSTTRFDVVHGHHPMWVGDWASYYAKWMGVPLVTTIHTQYDIYARMLPIPNAILKAYLEAKVRTYCNRCTLVTTPGYGSLHRLRRLKIKTPMAVVPNPIVLADFWTADGSKVRDMYGFAPDDFVVGYVGRLSQEKNLGTYLDAAEIFLSQLPQAKVMLVGDGTERSKLMKRVATMENGDRIVFTGNVPYASVPEHCAAFDLFLTASLSEVQPLSLAEAMACGKGVVAFDIPGCNDMVDNGHNGFLVPLSAEGGGLAEAVLRCASDPNQLARISGAAREWAKRYDQRAVVEQMLQIYEAAIVRYRRLPAS